MTLNSLEVRWFWQQGDLPDGLFRLLEGILADAPCKSRRDCYVPTHRGDLGIKYRCEPQEPVKLETKARTTHEPQTVLVPGIVGHVEGWTKWSFLLGEAPMADGSLPLTKHRRLRTFAAEGSSVHPVPPGVRPPQGCAVELTELKLELPPGGPIDGGTRGQAPALVHWTFALEAFGPDAHRRPILKRIAELLRERAPGLELSPERSMSYPGWLHRMHRRVGAPAET